MLAILSATQEARDRLPSRRPFASRVYSALIESVGSERALDLMRSVSVEEKEEKEECSGSESRSMP